MYTDSVILNHVERERKLEASALFVTLQLLVMVP